MSHHAVKKAHDIFVRQRIMLMLNIVENCEVGAWIAAVSIKIIGGIVMLKRLVSFGVLALGVAVFSPITIGLNASAVDYSGTQTIELTEDVSNVVIKSGAKITLKLAGHNVLSNGDGHAVHVETGAELIITGAGEVRGGNKIRQAALFNEGKVTIDGGTYIKDDGGSGGRLGWYTIVNHGDMTINDGDFKTINPRITSNPSALIDNGYQNPGVSDANPEIQYNEGRGLRKPTLTINYGNFYGAGAAIKNDYNGIATINAGYFTTQTDHVVINRNDLTVLGGTFSRAEGATGTVTAFALSNANGDESNGKLTINGDAISMADYLYGSYDGSKLETPVTITGGSFNGERGVLNTANINTDDTAILSPIVTGGSFVNPKINEETLVLKPAEGYEIVEDGGRHIVRAIVAPAPEPTPTPVDPTDKPVAEEPKDDDKVADKPKLLEETKPVETDKKEESKADNTDAMVANTGAKSLVFGLVVSSVVAIASTAGAIYAHRKING